MWRGIVIFPPIGVHKLLNLFFPSLLPYRWSLLAWLGLPLLSVYLTVPVHTQWSLLAWLGLPLLSVYTIVLFQKKGHTSMSRATLFSVFSCNIPYIIGLTSLARVTLLLSI